MGATSYTRAKGLINDYVVHFLRVNVCNSLPMGKEQCDAVSRYHKIIGFKDWEDISPEETSNTPGLRQVAKLCLNILPGETAHTSGLTASKLFDNDVEFINAIIRRGYTTYSRHEQLMRTLCRDEVFSNIRLRY